MFFWKWLIFFRTVFGSFVLITAFSIPTTTELSPKLLLFDSTSIFTIAKLWKYNALFMNALRRRATMMIITMTKMIRMLEHLSYGDSLRDCSCSAWRAGDLGKTS